MSNKDDHLILTGTVITINNEVATVDCDGTQIQARISGRLRFKKIRIVTGDLVEIKVSLTDTSRGLINRRIDRRS